ncbi:MAG: hypothetical protein CVU50_00130 [Candidatus Cloacimonetes bacterium HGW-Cloacimonetes-3]|jgi:hypothetical protein|nr:MAG: hypothetical protein CVU50_00130 [Candidatus Cloacimonetes bacterium HGW-Cloacimonetes-3]
MNRAYYNDQIKDFLTKESALIIAELAENNEFTLLQTQRDAWNEEIKILKSNLDGLEGKIYLEYSIPRMGKRVDAIVIIGPVIFVIEFKIGAELFSAYAVDQVWDYALDLQNFHETSHDKLIVPLLINTQQGTVPIVSKSKAQCLLKPIKCPANCLHEVLVSVVNQYSDCPPISIEAWEEGRYHPTPTIVEAATALYRNHSVENITRSEAGAINISQTSAKLAEIIRQTRAASQKAICFVTGVPGSGKTLVGLDIATKFIDRKDELYSVFLSGNGPLVGVLQEALYQDCKQQVKEGLRPRDLAVTRSDVKMFIQIVHHFRDASLIDERPPIEHVAIFDEAQRAWDLNQTCDFMKRKKNRPGFSQSEPEFLISCMERHQDWAVIICLVGGGQEINTGEAGIGEWLDSIMRSCPHWKVYISPQLTDSEYRAEEKLSKWVGNHQISYEPCLHLAVSMRSFRAEAVSQFVKHLLDLELENAKDVLSTISNKYPIVLTRNLNQAKSWIKTQARGSERYGIVVSSQAERLKPHAIDVKTPVNPIHWFLKGKDDVRSSYYMEDVATEFMIQGLELDWACVVCDGDFRFTNQGWGHWSFRGSKWQRINKPERQEYQKNAYRVLLTRARQGLVIVVPEGDEADPTRDPAFYDPIYHYFKAVGVQEI